MGKTEVKAEGGQNLFALCNRHETDRRQMKDKGKKKKKKIFSAFAVLSAV